MSVLVKNNLYLMLLGALSGLVALLTILPVFNSCLILSKSQVTQIALQGIALLIITGSNIMVFSCLNGSLKKVALKFILLGGIIIYICLLWIVFDVAELATLYTTAY